jgi:hypothetical protein
MGFPRPTYVHRICYISFCLAHALAMHLTELFVSSSFSDHGTLANPVHSGLATTWEALFVYDSIIFSLTMAKTWKGRHHGITRISIPVVRLVFRDGKSCDQVLDG